MQAAIIMFIALCGAVAGILLLMLARQAASRMTIGRRARQLTHQRDGGGKPAMEDGQLSKEESDPWRRFLLNNVPDIAGRLLPALESAGMGGRLPMLCAATGGATVFLLGWGLAMGLAAASALMLATAVPGLGLVLLLRWLRQRRRKAFLNQLPDAIGLMVRGLRAGTPVLESIHDVGRELPAPLGPTFRHAYEQALLGQSIEQSLADGTAGLDLPPMNFLIVTLSVQRETGGNLAETLVKLDFILRRREQMRQKAQALSSEARASAFIIGSLPLAMAVLMWLVAPDYIRPLFLTPGGHMLLGAGLLSLLAGGWLMAMLSRIEQ